MSNSTKLITYLTQTSCQWIWLAARRLPNCLHPNEGLLRMEEMRGMSMAYKRVYLVNKDAQKSQSSSQAAIRPAHQKQKEMGCGTVCHSHL
jgi:hypothetical protein